jgi:phosphohistidine phosphatase
VVAEEVKTLLILRHAKSSWDDGSLPDHDRPLNGRGKRDAPRMGRYLVESALAPHIVLASTARRARATAMKVMEECGWQGELRLLRSLYLAEPTDYVLALRTAPAAAERALVVGHNPGLESLIEGLTGESLAMPTAALAVLSVDVGSWAELSLDGRAKIASNCRPKDLD